jgi:hypothetical protein
VDFCEHCYETLCSIKGEEFPKGLIAYEFLKDCFP